MLGLVLIGTACTSPTTSTDHAPHWSWLGDTNTATQGGQVAGLSCASPSLCVAVGAYNPTGDPGQIGDLVSTFDGDRWSQEEVLVAEKFERCINHFLCARQGNGLYVISCAPTRFCMTVDTVSQSYMYDGRKWTEIPFHYGLPLAIYKDGTASSESCPSRNFCMAINNIDIMDTFDGSTWGAPQRAFAGNVAPSDIWCRSAHFCIVFGLDGIHTYNGTSWSRPVTNTATGFPESWSCLLYTDCEFSNGFTVPWLPGFGSAAASVSCVTKTFCMSVAGTSYREYSGSQWSKPRSLPDALTSDLYLIPESNSIGIMPQLSCLSSHFCLLVAPDGVTWVWR
jgi:hypothetical protein